MVELPSVSPHFCLVRGDARKQAACLDVSRPKHPVLSSPMLGAAAITGDNV